jgi:alkyl hydroperoxide reductase subunit F
MENTTYDLIIIGGSAAATAAGVYAARRNLNFKIITKEFGGEVATSGYIENWPGIIHTDGISLAQQFKEHLLANKAVIEEGIEVTGLVKNPDGSFTISAGDNTYQSKAVILTTGVHPRPLGVPGEKEFRNKGVTYCTTCDGPLFQDKVTTVIGGGNSALESALMLVDIASQVYIINKNEAFKGEQVLIDKVSSDPKIKIVYSAATTEVVGDGFVTSVRYMLGDGSTHEIKTDGVFVHVGMIPNSAIVPAAVKQDAFHQIIVDANCMTNVPGLFAAGDVTNVPFKQIVIAAGQGCTALLSAVQYLNKS